MTLRVAIQMDDIASINPLLDSTLLLGIESCRRGHEVFYYTPDKLTYNAGDIRARVYPIKFFDNAAHYYELGEEFSLDLRTLDVVLLRQDPPFNMTYLTTTYLLEMLASSYPNSPSPCGRGLGGGVKLVVEAYPPPRPSPARGEGEASGGGKMGVLVVNDPASVRNHPEKIFPTLLREFMPPTLISADVREIEEFYAQHKDIILKPLYGYGGRAVLHLQEGDSNLLALSEMLFSQTKEPIIAQKFLPEVKSEDKRIILVDGEVAGSFGRIPASGSIRSNILAGGRAVKTHLTSKQLEICEALRQPLKDKGLIFVGLDVIGDFLTEINITSPGGIPEINDFMSKNLEKNIWDAIESKL